MHVDMSSYTYDIIAFEVIRIFRFELREIAKYIRIIKIAAFKYTHSDKRYNVSFSYEKGMQFCILTLVPIINGLKIINTTLYIKFIEGKDHTPMLDVLSNDRLGKDGYGLHLFYSLLEDNETYEQGEQNTVYLKDKLVALYSFLFNNNLKSSGLTIGELSLNDTTKKELMKISTLLSKYTDLG